MMAMLKGILQFEMVHRRFLDEEVMMLYPTLMIHWVTPKVTTPLPA
jgi:hypothetical protein